MMSKNLEEQMKEWRQHFHSDPELAFEEKQTSEYIAQLLNKMGLEVHRGIGGTGIVADLKVGNSPIVIGLRADMDAIAMAEKTDLPYASKNAGIMHACGHDGHMATLLGAAHLLYERKNFNGTVRFLFQPAEEPGKGAQAMIDDGLFKRFPMDEIYGLHNGTDIPEGTIHTRSGGILASEDNFIIRIKGKGAHASSPHLSIDPLVTAAQMILAFQSVVSRNASPLEQAVISCTEIHTDGVHNAIPSNVEILGDTRSCTPEIQELIERRMKIICESTCRMNGAGCEWIYTHEFAPTFNAEACVKIAVAAAENIVGKENVNSNCRPLMASEDFGVFLRHIPGCFVLLGGGKSKNPNENIPPHNSMYDYNDDILLTGASFFAELIRIRMPQ
ncbi:MAG: amidohydrolase [Clostridia bacterium]|nr:amidohydrolase [Clostridia bacterium]